MAEKQGWLMLSPRKADFIGANANTADDVTDNEPADSLIVAIDWQHHFLFSFWIVEANDTSRPG